jgi:hypothetical protein
MINNISWTSYCYVLIQLLVIYYAFVLWYYYRKDFLQVLRSKFQQRNLLVAEVMPSAQEVMESKKKNGHHESSLPIDTVTFRGDLMGYKINTLVQGLSDEIKAYLRQAGKAGVVKEELLFSIHQILQKYPALKDSAFQPSINNLIVFELKNKCSTYLSSEEASALWEI